MTYKIKEAREKSRMTQEELARKSGVSRYTIVRLESGKNITTSSKTLLALAQALDTTLASLISEA